MKRRLWCVLGVFALPVLLMSCGYSLIRIERTYDESGILTESGKFLGHLSEAKGGFQLSRSDKTAAGDEIVETAGANAEWTSEAGRMTMAEFFQSVRVLGALAASVSGMPSGTNLNAGPPMTLNIPPTPVADKPTTGTE